MIRVLIVEWSSEARRWLTDVFGEGLIDGDFSVRVIGSTECARAMLFDRLDPGVDLLITNNRQPNSVSGLELIRLAKDLKPPFKPVRKAILTTGGFFGLVDENRARMAGADQALRKPYSINALARAIERCFPGSVRNLYGKEAVR